ncbi:SAM-dependent methyltransferase [Entomobacter blattae]|uniref:Cyclopropane-fatty-acyl-phospholipid synthase n=1 Tax=Entomobacter blattae TaxID=2762277 RepID=A0A7H1NV14_9PROT|nr:cyclopropane-fatty-acyl-phospholipid synthase family protein [Entomobacter blattae]QNT79624.1 Cyclopropane-fatty-acyl-phospholipid synthase [Entomobacter blattae]
MITLLSAVLKRFITRGTLEVIYPDGRKIVYRGSDEFSASMRIHSENVVRGLLLNPGLAFGEAYMDGLIEPVNCTLYALMQVIMSNDLGAGHVGEKVSGFLRYVKRSWSQFNPEKRAQKNVAHHYDLSRDFYKLFLDEDMQYSCAYFSADTISLEQAQLDKKRHIAAKMLLDKPDLEVLDIGCGWGGMAITLAKEYGAKVTGITLSKEQLVVARQRVEEEGLQGQVRFELIDYRKVRKTFDRIVSVGMFEHVGVGYYDTFFSSVRRCLKDEGIMLLHSIGRSDGAGSTNPWIAKYIFPGGYSPSLSETFHSVEKSGLWVADCEVLRFHYAMTLAEWYKRFRENCQAVIKMYDERFYRMFSLYLVGAELTFRYQGHMNFQLQLTPSANAIPLTRDYMFNAEKDHEAKYAGNTFIRRLLS